jgi:hypothetical protein
VPKLWVVTRCTYFFRMWQPAFPGTVFPVIPVTSNRRIGWRLGKLPGCSAPYFGPSGAGRLELQKVGGGEVQVGCGCDRLGIVSCVGWIPHGEIGAAVVCSDV